MDSIQSVMFLLVNQMRLMKCGRIITQFSSSATKKMTLLMLDQMIKKMGMEGAIQLDLYHFTVSTVIAPHLLI
ncbi:hypothetical protein EUGRSUZ_B02758 [Eucalyptus grandis]|uniref:Uncharacterized protein n=2 Tax=Eucalyptus grandis TaxID=71139 RepID=A0ACC3M1P4_EUCGR|nr:hypothetical protein EUGRSUZ_B02758 [Eucalyptus grandis]